MDNLAGADVLIPTMGLITKEILKTHNQLRLFQQCGSGLESVDVTAAKKALGLEWVGGPENLTSPNQPMIPCGALWRASLKT